MDLFISCFAVFPTKAYVPRLRPADGWKFIFAVRIKRLVFCLLAYVIRVFFCCCCFIYLLIFFAFKGKATEFIVQGRWCGKLECSFLFKLNEVRVLAVRSICHLAPRYYGHPLVRNVAERSLSLPCAKRLSTFMSIRWRNHSQLGGQQVTPTPSQWND